MEQATTIGLDIAKHVFQVHGADAAGHVLFRKRITRAKLLGFLAAQARCVVAMEACAGAHYWAREIAKDSSKNNLNTSHNGRWLAWPQSVVPLAVKLVAFDGQFGEFLV